MKTWIVFAMYTFLCHYDQKAGNTDVIDNCHLMTPIMFKLKLIKTINSCDI